MGKKIVRLDKYLEHVDSATKLDIESHISTCEVELDELVIKRVSLENTNIEDYDEEKNISEGYASTRVIDFSGDIVVPEGIILDVFSKNPVIFYNHNKSSLPIGKAVDSTIDDYGLKIKVQYAVDENPEANTVFKLVKGKYIRQHSIGFIPLALLHRGQKGFDALNKKLQALYPEYKGNADRIITKTLLLEVSVVNIADNQASMIEEVKTWEDGEKSLKRLGIYIKDASDAKEEPKEAVEAPKEEPVKEAVEEAVCTCTTCSSCSASHITLEEPVEEPKVEDVVEDEPKVISEPVEPVEPIEAAPKIERVVSIERVKSKSSHFDEMARKGIIVRVPKD